jgi:nicotinate-nucleotide adenylyltransferase
VRIGLFGGTFNPPHSGHLIVAEHVLEAMSLDQIVFIPSAISPHKLGQTVPPPSSRLAMLQLAVRRNRRFSVSSIEAERGGISFTIDTVEEFKKLYSMDELFFIIVMTRQGVGQITNTVVEKEGTIICEVPSVGISSREIRQRVKEGKSIRYLVPSEVEEYITEYGLYKDDLG